jgi:hypothetical protein
MKHCKNCGTEVTFWMMQKQLTPFRFKCSTCRAQYRISTPGMHLVMVGLVLIMLVMALILGFGGEHYGLVFVIPCVAVIFCMGFGIEVWVQKLIAKKGQFIFLDDTAEAYTADESESEDVVSEHGETDTEENNEPIEDEVDSLKEVE